MKDQPSAHSRALTMTHSDIRALDAIGLRAALAGGQISALAVAEAYLAQIATREPEIRAFAWIDPEHVRAQARALDARRASGAPLGALHGLPVGLKDVIDTAGIPTANGCALDAGRVPATDAHVVARLKAEGALIMGKTVTTELAYLHPGPTRNPHNPAHTPGGSSSGSAAGVAAGMLLLAIGTQTGGSVIRPASFCGITGFKPSFGAIGRTGVLLQSHTLDTLGVFARSPAEAALLADVLFGHDPQDDDSAPGGPAPGLLETVQAGLARTPRLAFLRLPGWDRADADLRAACQRLAEDLGARPVDLPQGFGEAAAQRGLINDVEMAHYYAPYAAADAAAAGAGAARGLSQVARDAIDRGRSASGLAYLGALAARGPLYEGARAILAGVDAILCPAALGGAPAGLASTGDSIFNGIWTFTGVPAVTVPVMTAANGLPMGAQIVCRRGEDAQALAIAAWLLAQRQTHGSR
jgi:Asp-tRNA(Asn)/Glu-tRNA(Gln) amidotransferase A subunit family amidase